MADNKVGEAYVEIDARTAKLQKGLKDAEKKTKESTGKINRSLNSVGESVEKTTQGVRKLSGAIGSVFGVFTQWVGIITLVVGAYKSLSSVLTQTREEAEALRQEVERSNAAYESSVKSVADFKREMTADTFDPVQQAVASVTSSFESFRAAQEEAYSAGAINADEITRRIREGREELEKRVDRIFQEVEAREALIAQQEKERELETEIANMRQARAEAERAIAKEKREQEEQQRRDADAARRRMEEREEQQRRDAEAARRRMEDRVKMIERERKELERIVALQREINSLGIGGTAGNVGATTTALGASRIRKGP